MPKILEIPEVGRVQFPDTMTDGEIDQAAGELYDRHQLDKEGEAARRGEARADTAVKALQVAEDVAGRISLGGLSRIARAAAVDLVTPGLPVPGGGGRALGAEIAGLPTPPVQAAQVQESAVRSGLVQAAGAVPMVGASMALMSAGIPPIPAMAGPAGIQTFEETGSLKEAGKAAGIAAMIPPAGALGRAAASKVMGEAIGRGFMRSGATGAQKAIEATAGQVAVQALMEGSRLPEYIKATPEQRRFMLVESLIANVALGVPDAVTALRPGPSGTQQALRPEVQVADALRQAVQDPAVTESLQRQVDAAVADHMSGADWAKEFVPKPENLDRPTVPPPPMIDPGGAAQRLAATAGLYDSRGEATPEARWKAIENTYKIAKAAQEALPGVPLDDIQLIVIRRVEPGKTPAESEEVDQVFVPRDKMREAVKELGILYPAGQFMQSIETGLKPYSPRKGEPSFKAWLAGERPTFEPPAETTPAVQETTQVEAPPAVNPSGEPKSSLMEPKAEPPPVTPAPETPPEAKAGWYVEKETDRAVFVLSKDQVKALPSHIRGHLKRFFLFSPTRGGYVSKGLVSKGTTMVGLVEGMLRGVIPDFDRIPPRPRPEKPDKLPKNAPPPEPPPKFEQPQAQQEAPPVQGASVADLLRMAPIDDAAARQFKQSVAPRVQMLRDERAQRQQTQKILDAKVLSQRGPRWSRGKVKASARRQDVEAREAVIRRLAEIDREIEALQKAGLSEADKTIEQASTVRVINDPSQPMVKRLAMRSRLFAEAGEQAPESLAKALEAEAAAEILKVYPDAIPEEVQAMVPEVVRYAMGASDAEALKHTFRMAPELNLKTRRIQELQRAMEMQPMVPWRNDIGAELQAQIHSAKTGAAVSRAELDRLKAELRKTMESSIERMDRAAKEANRQAEADAALRAQQKEAEAKLISEAEEIAKSQPSSRKATEVKRDLVARLEEALAAAPEAKGADGKPFTVVIGVPGDGVFVLTNTKEAIGKVLAKAKRMGTSPGGKSGKPSWLTPAKPVGGLRPDQWLNSSEPTHRVFYKAGKGEVAEAMGVQVAFPLPGFDGQDFYLTAIKGQENFTVTERKTGLKIGEGPTYGKAMADAEEKLKRFGFDTYKRAMDKALEGAKPMPDPVPLDDEKPPKKSTGSKSEGYPGRAEGDPAQAYPGGPIGTERAHPADAPGFTQFPIELPEAVRFSRDLLGGKYPKVLERLRILKGQALGVFSHRDAPATPFGEISLRADIFDLLTPEEKARLRAEAEREAEEIGGDPAEIARMARERFEAKLEAAYEEAKARPPLMALKVLWHEIGHLVDWLPDHMIQGRGNLFGRIASLKDYLLHTLPADPDTPHRPITEADRAKLWRLAEKQLRDELGPMQEIIETILVEEPIYRDSGVTPEMVKDLFGMDAREKTPDLYRWFAEQPAAVKKEIVKKAMQGMVDERIAKLGGREQIGTRKVERQVRKVAGRQPTAREIQQRFRELFRQEMENRRLVDLATLKAELEPLIAWWRGVPKMEAYFRPSVEMYAEAFSVLMNNPAAVAKRAPTYYRMMHDYMGRKPQVKELYEAIQDQIRAGTVMRGRVEELRGSWRRDDARSLQRWRERFGTKARDFLDNVLYHYDRRFGPVYRAARGSKAEPRVRDAVGNFIYRAAEHERFLSRMNDRVGGRLVANNLDWADLGEYLFHRRVINERFNLANSQGWSSNVSMKRLAELQAQIGPERWAVLEDAGKAFREIYAEQVIPLMKEARLWGPELQQKIDDNVFYATFAAVRDMPDTGIERALELSYGPTVTPHIYRQIGHLGEIKNPATATVLKALSLMSAAHRNIAKREIVRMLREAQPEEITPAKRRWTGRRMEAQEVNTDRVGTITFLEDGKPQSWYVPRLMADAINSGSPVESRLAGAMVGALNWQKGLFTQLNYGFWPVNFLRDSAGFFLNMPGVTGPVAAWVRNLPRAIVAARASVKGKANPDADAALRRLMLIAREDPRGVLSDVVDEFELKVAGYGLDPAQWDKELSGARRAVGWWQRYREAGQAMERVNKIQGMLYLDQDFPTMPEWQKREVVRERAGSPNFLEKGASNWHADLVALFYNAWKQGIRQTVNAARANPWSFAAKAAAGTALPSIAMAAANSGVLGDDMREAFRSIPDYDLTNYLVIPLRWVDRKQGKVAYLRLPLPESMRLFHGLLYRTLTGRGAGYAAFMGGQVPSLNPMLQVAGAWMQYAVAGQNPFDLHTGQNILDDTTFEAGGMPAATEMGKWTWNAMGGGIIHRFKNARLESPPEGAGEEILAAPGVANLVGRWIKVSNRGLADEDRRVTAPVEQYRAQVRLAVRSLVDRWARAGVLEGQGQVAPAAVLTEMSQAERTLLRDPYAMDYLLATLPNVLQARQSPLLARLGQANSKAAKLAILSNEMARGMQPSQQPKPSVPSQPVLP